MNNPKPNPLGSYGGFNKPNMGAKPLGGMGNGSYKYGGISSGIGGISNSGLGIRNDAQNPYYQENSQGAQGSIGSSGSGMQPKNGGSRGSDFKLPSVPNKMAMGGLRGLPGMPGSKGLESRGAKSKGGIKPPIIGAYKSNLGAGY